MDVSARKVAAEVLEVIPLVTRRVAADLRKSERSMKLSHVHVLGLVARNPLSLSELSDIHSASMPTMSKTITTIENLGWVVRTRSEADRRVVMVEATTAGRTALKAVYIRALAPIHEALDPLSETERRRLSVGLKILRDTFADTPTEREGKGPGSGSSKKRNK